MFRFWGREIAGWTIVLIGLYFVFISISLMLTPPPGPEAILEGPPIGILGLFVFRGGIHLLKVAVAARVCMAAQTQPTKPPAPTKRAKKAESPWDW